MSEPIRVLITDDHRVVRQGLRGFLETYADIQVVAEAENGVQAVNLTREYVPDVILMDLLMPEMDGVEAINQIAVFECLSKKQEFHWLGPILAVDEKVSLLRRSIKPLAPFFFSTNMSSKETCIILMPCGRHIHLVYPW